MLRINRMEKLKSLFVLIVEQHVVKSYSNYCFVSRGRVQNSGESAVHDGSVSVVTSHAYFLFYNFAQSWTSKCIKVARKMLVYIQVEQLSETKQS